MSFDSTRTTPDITSQLKMSADIDEHPEPFFDISLGNKTFDLKDEHGRQLTVRTKVSWRRRGHIDVLMYCDKNRRSLFAPENTLALFETWHTVMDGEDWWTIGQRMVNVDARNNSKVKNDIGATAIQITEAAVREQHRVYGASTLIKQSSARPSVVRFFLKNGYGYNDDPITQKNLTLFREYLALYDQHKQNTDIFKNPDPATPPPFLLVKQDRKDESLIYKLHPEYEQRYFERAGKNITLSHEGREKFGPMRIACEIRIGIKKDLADTQ